MNYNLIQDSEILQKLGKTFKAKKKTITWQEVSISMKPPNCIAMKFIVTKESYQVWNATKRNKQILDAEFKKINLKTILITSNYLKVKHK